jgi:pyrrolidone-carboxylate peptidase
MSLLGNWRQLLIALCAILGTLQSANAQPPEGGTASGNSGTVAVFPFEEYDYFRIAPDGDSIQLVPVTRQELGLYTFSEHAGAIANLIALGGSAMSGNIPDAAGRVGDVGQWLSGFTVTLGSQGGGGIVMVKKQDPVDGNAQPSTGNPLGQVIVIVSGFGPWGPITDNNSTTVAGVICDKLKENRELLGQCGGFPVENVVIDVIWGQPDKTVDEVVTTVKANNPDKKIIWIGLDIGGGFKLETVGENDRLPGGLDAGGSPPPPGSTNEPGGPPTSGGGYAPGTIITTLTSHGIPIVVSNDMDGFLCTSLCYKLHRMDETGRIDTGIFIHIPPVTDGTINDKFADGLIDVIKDLAEELTVGQGAAGGTGGGTSGGGGPENQP